LPRCGRCNSDLPPPTCVRCGIAVGWGENLCFRCSQLGRSLEPRTLEGPTGGWRFQGKETPLVGRAREQHLLREAFRTVVELQTTALVTVTGAAGLGKTRLASTFQAQLGAHCDRYTVARGRAREGERDDHSLFRSVIADRFYMGSSLDSETVKLRLREGVASILGPDEATELAHRIGHLGGLDFPDSPVTSLFAADPNKHTEQAYDALARLFKADARQAPLVLVLDDVHLAADGSLDLIQYLLTSIQDAPLLILCLAAPSLLERRPRWGAGSYLNTTIELTPLADAETEQLFRALLADFVELPASLVDLAVARAMGNPATLEQVTRILLEKGVLCSTPAGGEVHLDRLDPGQIPGTLGDLLRARLEGLSTEEHLLLQQAAIVGLSFWVGALVVQDRLDSDKWLEDQRFWRSTRREERLAQLLAGLERKDLIRRVRASRVIHDSEYQFKHRAERDLLYQQVEPARRLVGHKVCAQWLEIGVAKRADPLIELIAAHYEQGGCPRKAAFSYIHAGDRARERYANEQTVAFYEKGLALLDEDEVGARIEVCRSLGTVLALIGQHEDALCFFREMLRLAWRIGDRAKGGVAYEKLGQVYRTLGEHRFAMDSFQRARELFERDGDERGIAAVLGDIGRVHWLQGHLELAEQNLQESLRRRRELGDPRSIALALGQLGGVLIGRGQLAEAMSTLRESLELRRQVGDRRGEAESLNAFGAIFFERGHPERATRLWSEGVTLCRATGDREILAYLLNNIGEAHIEEGRLDEAVTSLDEALAICKETQSLRTRATVLRNLGRVRLGQGDGATARQLATEALEIGRRVGLRVVEGQALCLLGDIASQTLFATDEGPPPEQEAEGYFRQALEVFDEVGDLAEQRRCLQQAIRFLDERGRTREASELQSRRAAVCAKLQR